MIAAALPAAMLTPLVGACAAVLLGGAGRTRAVVVATCGGSVAAAVALVSAVWYGMGGEYALAGWGPPLGIALRADGFSAGMVLLTALASLPLTIYASGYYAPGGAEPAQSAQTRRAFWPLWLFLLASLHALFLSGDAFNMYVALELMTMAALALVMLAPGERTSEAVMRYLIAAVAGSLVYLLGAALLFAQTGTMDLRLIGERLAPGLPTNVAVALVTAGLALKGALFPLHFWLPRAHASAPAPVSGMLSAFVVAGAIYILLRLWLESFVGVLAAPAGQLVGWLGAGGIVWGSLQAIRQQRLKLMIGYSTVAQVGYFMLVLPLAALPDGDWRFAAWSGGIYLIAAHACAKAAMFMAAGCVMRAMGHDRIVGVSGIASHLPVTTYAFGIAGVSLIGLPPSGGFIGKWLLLSAALESGQWWWVVVIVLGGVLTAGYVFLVLGQELSQARSDERPHFQPVPARMEYAAMAMALVALLLGLRATEPLALLAIGSPVPTVFGHP